MMWNIYNELTHAQWSGWIRAMCGYIIVYASLLPFEASQHHVDRAEFIALKAIFACFLASAINIRKNTSSYQLFIHQVKPECPISMLPSLVSNI